MSPIFNHVKGGRTEKKYLDFCDTDLPGNCVNNNNTKITTM